MSQITPTGLPLSSDGKFVDTTTMEWLRAVSRLNRENLERVRAQAPDLKLAKAARPKARNRRARA